MKKNERHVIEIEHVTAKGFGVGHINDFALFVDGGLPGDKILAHVLKVKKRYGYGKTVEIITPSPARIKSPCPVSERCGGCQWQHCEYQAQLGFKKRIVIDALERIGGVSNPPVSDVIGMEVPGRYRNKAVFPIVPADNSDGFAIGMYAPRSHRMVEVSDCGIQHEAHIKILAVVKDFMRRRRIKAYDEAAHKGLARFVIIRTSRAAGEIMVVLSVNGRMPGEAELARELTGAGVTTFIISRNESRGNAVLGGDFRVISGQGFIRERIGHVEYQLSAPSFFQINPVQTKILYDAALSQAALDGTQVVFDAHAGVGGIALYAAKHAKSVLGVDIVAEAISDARKNAELNGINNARFVCGAAEEVIPELLANGEERPQVVFLDPPRKGCDPALLKALTAARVERIVYISCDPATLARDIMQLRAGGYDLKDARPVDMFPMTGKVEVSCLLEGIYK